jgi:hypothetical protein
MLEKLTPSGTVRAYCTQCLGLKRFDAEAISDCQGDQAYCGPCPFFPYRLGKRPPVKVFWEFCLDCMGGDRGTVSKCPSDTCPAYPYRYGKNPSLSGRSLRGIALRNTSPETARGGPKTGQISIFFGQGNQSPAKPE